jgi:hypothetical protein
MDLWYCIVRCEKELANRKVDKLIIIHARASAFLSLFAQYPPPTSTGHFETNGMVEIPTCALSP